MMNKTETAITIFGVFAFAYCITDSILSIYFRELGLNDVQISVVFSALSFSFIISSTIIGGLSEVVSKKHILLTSIALSGISYLLIVFGGTYSSLILSQIILGIGVSGITIISLSDVEKYVKTERGFKTGIAFSVQYLGKFIGPLSGALLAMYYTKKVSILFSSFSFLVLLFLASFIYKDKSVSKRRDLIDILLSSKKFFKRKEFEFLGVVGFLEMFMINIRYIFVPILLSSLGFSLVKIGVIVSLFYLFSSFESPIIGKIIDRVNPGIVIMASILGLSTSFILFYLSTNFYVFLLAAIIGSISIGALDVSVSESIFILTSRNQEELYGFFLSVSRVGGFIGFMVSGVVAQLFGLRYLFLIIGIGTIVGILYFIYKNPVIFNSRIFKPNV